MKVLKPGLFSRLDQVNGTEDIDVYLFTPSLFKAFPFQMEKVSISNRIRYIIEYFAGYKIYYIKKNSEWGGYCIVSNGRNFRYKFSNKDDIIFGRYFVKPELRGQGIGVKMINRALDKTDIDYKKAYAYVHRGNKASHATVRKLGCYEVGHLTKVGKIRKIMNSENGEYSLYCYG